MTSIESFTMGGDAKATIGTAASSSQITVAPEHTSEEVAGLFANMAYIWERVSSLKPLVDSSGNVTSNLPTVFDSLVVANPTLYASSNLPSNPTFYDQFITSIKDAINLAKTGKNGYFMNLEMTTALQELLNTLVAAGINVNVNSLSTLNTANADGINRGTMLSWLNFIQSSSVIQNILSNTGNAAVGGSHSLQGLTQLVYIRTANDILSSNLSDLEEAMQTNKDALSLLQTIQTLHNNIALTPRSLFPGFNSGADAIAAQNADLQLQYDQLRAVYSPGPLAAVFGSNLLKDGELVRRTLNISPIGSVNVPIEDLLTNIGAADAPTYLIHPADVGELKFITPLLAPDWVNPNWDTTVYVGSNNTILSNGGINTQSLVMRREITVKVFDLPPADRPPGAANTDDITIHLVFLIKDSTLSSTNILNSALTDAQQTLTNFTQPLVPTTATISNSQGAEFISLAAKLPTLIASLKAQNPSFIQPDGTTDPTTIAGKLEKVLADINAAISANPGTSTAAHNAALAQWILDSYNQTNTNNGLAGAIQTNITDAITTAQALNDSQKEAVQRFLFIFEEYQKSAASILSSIHQMILSMARNIRQ